MSHRLYHTEAILLGSRPYGEANRLLYLLTAELGLVLATVQGIRQQASKLRGQLTDYTSLRTTLVRGRGIWRLIGAEVVVSGPAPAALGEQWWWRLCHLARRLIHGELAEPRLFGRFIAWRQELSIVAVDGMLRHRGLLCHLELLQLLGYLPQRDLTDSEWVADDGRLVVLINRALAHSQL